MKMKFDDILKEIGELGAAQKWVYLLLSITLTTCSMQLMSWRFVGATPKFRCRIMLEDLNKSAVTYRLDEHIRNKTIPFDNITGDFSTCKRYEMTLSEGQSLSNWSLLHEDVYIIKEPEYCQKYVFDKSEYYSTVITDYAVICNQTWQQGMSGYAFQGGSLIGYSIVGNLADRFGRRPVFVASLMCYLALGFLLPCSPNYFIIFIFRILLGMNSASVYLCAYIMVVESIGSSKRTTLTLSTGYFYSFGLVLLALLAYLFRTWWVLQLAISTPALLFIGYYWLIPESIRWLMVKGKWKQARILLDKTAKFNRSVLPMSIINIFTEGEISTHEKKDNDIPASRTITNPKLRKITLILGFNFFVSFCLFDALMGTYSVTRNKYIFMFVIGILDVLGHTVCIIVLNRSGRRYPISLAIICASILYIVIVVLPSEHQLPIAAMAMLARFSLYICHASMFYYSAELYPTIVRGTGMGICFAFASVGDIFGYAVSKLLEIWPYWTAGALAILAVVSSFLVFLLPETLGRSLPDFLEDMENNVTKPHDPESTVRTLVDELHQIREISSSTETLQASDLEKHEVPSLKSKNSK